MLLYSVCTDIVNVVLTCMLIYSIFATCFHFFFLSLKIFLRMIYDFVASQFKQSLLKSMEKFSIRMYNSMLETFMFKFMAQIKLLVGRIQIAVCSYSVPGFPKVVVKSQHPGIIATFLHWNQIRIS